MKKKKIYININTYAEINFIDKQFIDGSPLNFSLDR